MSKLALVIVFAALGCGTQKPSVLHPQVQYGPAASIKPNRVLALTAMCGSVEKRCPKEYVQSVDAIVRSGLEFAGYAVVDSESLRLAARVRHEEHTSTETVTKSAGTTEIIRPIQIFDATVKSEATTTTESETTFIVLDGANFDDLSVDEKHQVIDKSNTDSVATVRIVVGGKMGVWEPNQNVEVMVKLGVNRGDEMAWASRCTASSNEFSTVGAALEQAARCAMRGATGS